MNRLCAAALLCLIALPLSAQAGLIAFRSNIIPRFELTLNPVLTGLPDPVTLPGVASGYLDFEFDFDSSAPTLEFVSVSGQFRGSLLNGQEFDLLATRLDVGTATNVTSSGGLLTGADLDFSVFFEMYPDGGPRLEPISSLPFSGSITGLPIPVGTVFAGPPTPPTPPVPGSAYIPDGMGGEIEIMNAVSVQNRTLTTVPEPGSFAVFGCAVFAAVAAGRRKKKAKVD